MVAIACASEKFYLAILSMARGEGSLKTRLFDAYLIIHTLRMEDFPEDLRKEFAEIISKLTENETPVDDEGRVQATLNAMSDRYAWSLIEKIVKLYDEISRKYAIELLKNDLL